MTKNTTLATCLAGLLGTLALSPAQAADRAVADLLLEKGLITAEEHQMLLQNQPAPSTAAGPTIDLKQGLKITSADKRYSAKVGTYMQLDTATYKGAEEVDHNSGTEMRRGRLYLQGTLDKDWQYKFELELFGSSGTELTDGYVRYSGLDSANITAGHFKVPFSQEQLMSAKEVPFMERSLANAFVISRAPGVMVSSGGEHWSAAGMIMGERLYSNTGEDEGGGVSGRFTWAPVASTDNSLHFGISGQFREPTQAVGGETARFRARPESHQTDEYLINTGTITDVNDLQLYGLEVASHFGNTFLQAEYLQADVNRDNDADLSFNGWYAQGAWVLVGNPRTYNAATGLYGGVSSDYALGTGGIGAWELALRYSSMDLSDADIDGGKEDNVTIGVNWYPTRNLRLSGNWVHVVDIDGGPNDGESLHAIQVRMQLAY